MPIMLCQCNQLSGQRLAELFNELESKSLLPDTPLKAAGQVLQAGRTEPLRDSLSRVSGCCGGCLPHIEKIVREERKQAALEQTAPILEPVGR